MIKIKPKASVLENTTKLIIIAPNTATTPLKLEPKELKQEQQQVLLEEKQDDKSLFIVY